MRVLLVSTYDAVCGIAEHAAQLNEAVHATWLANDGRANRMDIEPKLLDPRAVVSVATPDILHLNWQAALHSRWSVDAIRAWQGLGVKVLITVHDSGVPNSDTVKALCEAADYFVLHEPYDDLPAHGEYLRMGVPAYPRTGDYLHDPRWTDHRPILGTVGFPFPWKCYDELARVTAACGWALLLLAPTATEEDVARWRAINPWIRVETAFWDRVRVTAQLAGCDATAFCYVTHGTGQSAAILQGIAARKPVLALATCRQFRALFADPLGRTAITWAETFEDVAFALSHFVRIERVSPAIVALAEQESWTKVGRRYAAIYEQLVGGAQ